MVYRTCGGVGGNTALPVSDRPCILHVVWVVRVGWRSDVMDMRRYILTGD